MLRRIAKSVVLSTCAILGLGIIAGGLGTAGIRSAAAADCGLGLGFVPATLSASPATIEAGEMAILNVDLGKPVWFECSRGTKTVSRIYNQRLVGLITLQLYSGDGQFAHLSYPSGFHIETFFTYWNEGKFEVGGVGSAPIISGDPSMTVIGTAKVLFDQELTHLPDGQTETFKDRSVSILVFARPTTVTVVRDYAR
jgi:hypothetical protein